MSERTQDLSPLHIAIPSHEVELVEIAIDVISHMGGTVDISSLVPAFLKLRGYIWDEGLETYVEAPHRSHDVPKRMAMDTVRVFQFAKEDLTNQRTVTELWAIKDTHELSHFVWVYKFALEQGSVIDPLTYIEGIAAHLGLHWNEESRDYKYSTS